jgi:hypothetical protein
MKLKLIILKTMKLLSALFTIDVNNEVVGQLGGFFHFGQAST